MTKVDLFELVRSNEKHIDEKYNTIKGEARITEFVDKIEQISRISINRKAQALLELLRDNTLVSGVEDARRNGFEFKDYLEIQWKEAGATTIKRRVVFSEVYVFRQLGHL